MRSARAAILSVLSSDSTAEAFLNDEQFWDAARGEGMLPLLVDRLAAREWPVVTDERRARLARERADDIARAAADLLDARRVLLWLDDAGVPTLVVKGAALAHTLYEHPHLRPIQDVDLLIRKQDATQVRAMFEAHRAEWIPHVSGDFVLSQFHYATSDAGGCRHTYDVHWRAVNPLAFAHLFQWEALASAAVPVPALGPHARTVTDVVALQLACAHKAAHHRGSDRLIWLFDIHLLAERLDPAAAAQLVTSSVQGGISRLVGQGLAEAHEAYGGRSSAVLAAALGRAVRNSREATEYFVSRDRGAVGDLVSDFRALQKWSDRLQFARELVLPPAAYMRRRYADAPRVPLPLLYLARLLAGGVRRLRGH